MISINAIELSPYLVMTNLGALPTTFGFERTTLGGRVISRRMAGRKRRFVLVAERSDRGLYGYFTHEQIVLLAAIRDAGTVVPFVYHALAASVVVPMDGIQVTPLFRRTDPLPTLLYYGSITCHEV